MVGSHTSWAVALALGEVGTYSYRESAANCLALKSNIVIRPSPIEDAKALKNSVRGAACHQYSADARDRSNWKA
jgi:hypothetical protein